MKSNDFLFVFVRWSPPSLLQGVIMQSLDVLDFSVIHLSAYERSSHKHRYYRRTRLCATSNNSVLWNLRWIHSYLA
jgi:hypothetical protein